MADIKVVVITDEDTLRRTIKDFLNHEENIDVVGEGVNGQEAIDLARKLKPDVILMDITMPVKSGIDATQDITAEMPNVSVIIMSKQTDPAYLQSAMDVGASAYLIKPVDINGAKIGETIRKIYAKALKRRGIDIPVQQGGKVITLCSTKGGIGKSLISANLASCLSKELQKKTVIVDFNFQFGDIARLLDIQPKCTLADFVKDPSQQLCTKTIEDFLVVHPLSGLSIFPSPANPQDGEDVIRKLTIEQVKNVFDILKSKFQYIVVDTPVILNNTIKAALEFSDKILLLVALDYLTIENTILTLNWLVQKGKYSKDKLKVVLNRSLSEEDFQKKEELRQGLEEKLAYPISTNIYSNYEVALLSVNRREPFVISNPDSDIAFSIRELAHMVMDKKMVPKKDQSSLFSTIKKLFE